MRVVAVAGLAHHRRSRSRAEADEILVERAREFRNNVGPGEQTLVNGFNEFATAGLGRKELRAPGGMRVRSVGLGRGAGRAVQWRAISLDALERRPSVAKFTLFLGQFNRGDRIELYMTGGHKIVGEFLLVDELGVLQIEVKTETSSRAMQVYVDDLVAVSQ